MNPYEKPLHSREFRRDSLKLALVIHLNYFDRKKGGKIMAQNQLVQARVDEEIKAQATAALADMGLTVSDAVRMLLTRIAREKMMPLELMVPNATTRAAMEEAEKGDLPRASSIKELFEELNADD
ncbi:type II toxin-antitoxin system RelB/DinJ family antitoxin [Desulfococcaceae bacterium OttesenSCG-928-F15]|nr:type II toxin-antitoxin system RelB/DinJ family antitoxin [Desulfococcaceae bacterium OttesenSCG-928-F15]